MVSHSFTDITINYDFNVVSRDWSFWTSFWECSTRRRFTEFGIWLVLGKAMVDYNFWLCFSVFILLTFSSSSSSPPPGAATLLKLPIFSVSLRINACYDLLSALTLTLFPSLISAKKGLGIGFHGVIFLGFGLLTLVSRDSHPRSIFPFFFFSSKVSVK